MELEEMLAREAIRYTQSIYNSEGDRGRVVELAQAFTPTGVLDFGSGEHVGRDAIAAALSTVAVSAPTDAAPNATPAERGFIRHHLSTSRVEFRSPTEADGWTYFHVLTPIGLDHCGVYVDRFEQVGDRWLISHRRVKVDWRSSASLMTT